MTCLIGETRTIENSKEEVRKAHEQHTHHLSEQIAAIGKLHTEVFREMFVVEQWIKRKQQNYIDVASKACKPGVSLREWHSLWNAAERQLEFLRDKCINSIKAKST